MIRRTLLGDGRTFLVLADSITEVEARDASALVVTGSHGGSSSGRYAAPIAAALFAFNDAGIGKEAAGVAALAMLDDLGVASVAVSHDTARIGDAEDSYRNGTISAVNERASARGYKRGRALAECIEAWVARA